jgi:hypothetical protein
VGLRLVPNKMQTVDGIVLKQEHCSEVVLCFKCININVFLPVMMDQTLRPIQQT